MVLFVIVRDGFLAIWQMIYALTRFFGAWILSGGVVAIPVFGVLMAMGAKYEPALGISYVIGFWFGLVAATVSLNGNNNPRYRTMRGRTLTDIQSKE